MNESTAEMSVMEKWYYPILQYPNSLNTPKYLRYPLKINTNWTNQSVHFYLIGYGLNTFISFLISYTIACIILYIFWLYVYALYYASFVYTKRNK